MTSENLDLRTKNPGSAPGFTLKSLLERLKRDFDGSKIVSFQFTSKLLVSHFNMLFRSSRWF